MPVHHATRPCIVVNGCATEAHLPPQCKEEPAWLASASHTRIHTHHLLQGAHPMYMHQKLHVIYALCRLKGEWFMSTQAHHQHIRLGHPHPNTRISKSCSFAPGKAPHLALTGLLHLRTDSTRLSLGSPQQELSARHIRYFFIVRAPPTTTGAHRRNNASASTCSAAAKFNNLTNWQPRHTTTQALPNSLLLTGSQEHATCGALAPSQSTGPATPMRLTRHCTSGREL